MSKRAMRVRSQKGFTLLELMVVAGIAVTALVGLLGTYVGCLELTETTRNSEMAILSAQKVLEDMRTTAITGIYSTYNGYTFSIGGLGANASVGRVTVNASNPTLLTITVGVCWRQKGGRIIGECYNNSGVVAYNDSNGNGVLDSPVQITTLMTQR